MGLAATEATPGDAWENLVQTIQETAGPYLHQGAPRLTGPLALERRDHTSGETDASIFSLPPEMTKGILA